MTFSPNIPPLSLWLLAGSFTCLLLLAAIYFFRFRTVHTYRRRADRERPDKPEADYMPASVIVCSQGDAENLEQLLNTLLNQDYPCAYEVIVVNEGESADVKDVVAMLRPKHQNLYLTFTPEGVVNLSRKKLALTLGVKAARYDIAVLTTTAAEIMSDKWLRRIMFRFNRGNDVDIVLGYAYIDPTEDSKRGKRRRAFDYVAESMRWLGVAVAKKPFRGTEYNLAYRKSVFLKNKGFARSLNLRYGDDDIFISEISNGKNTQIELSDESMVRIRYGNHPRLSKERTFRRFTTESHIRRRPRFLMGLTGWLQIAAIASGTAAAVESYPNMQAAAIALAIIVLMLALDISTWRKSMAALKSRKLLLTIPYFSITYPLHRACQRIRARLSKGKKYTYE